MPAKKQAKVQPADKIPGTQTEFSLSKGSVVEGEHDAPNLDLTEQTRESLAATDGSNRNLLSDLDSDSDSPEDSFIEVEKNPLRTLDTRKTITSLSGIEQYKKTIFHKLKTLLLRNGMDDELAEQVTNRISSDILSHYEGRRLTKFELYQVYMMAHVYANALAFPILAVLQPQIVTFVKKHIAEELLGLPMWAVPPILGFTVPPTIALLEFGVRSALRSHPIQRTGDARYPDVSVLGLWKMPKDMITFLFILAVTALTSVNIYHAEKKPGNPLDTIYQNPVLYMLATTLVVMAWNQVVRPVMEKTSAGLLKVAGLCGRRDGSSEEHDPLLTQERDGATPPNTGRTERSMKTVENAPR